MVNEAGGEHGETLKAIVNCRASLACFYFRDDIYKQKHCRQFIGLRVIWQKDESGLEEYCKRSDVKRAESLQGRFPY